MVLKVVISAFERSDPNTHIPKYSVLVIYFSDPYSTCHRYMRPRNIKMDSISTKPSGCSQSIMGNERLRNRNDII